MRHVSLAIRFVGQLADQQFIRLGNFHIPEILDIPAFLWLLAHAWTCANNVEVRSVIARSNLATCNDLARIKVARYVFASKIYLERENERSVNAFRESITPTSNIVIILLTICARARNRCSSRTSDGDYDYFFFPLLFASLDSPLHHRHKSIPLCWKTATLEFSWRIALRACERIP